jgi:protein-S-isoprenylcysteine O-methyltransferase Ste14
LLYKKGIKVWVIGASAKNLFETVLENILFPALLLWSILIVLTALHISIFDTITANVLWLKYFGTILCYGGLMIFLRALASFGQAWRIGLDENNSNELITTGLFKHSRNPIFLFMDLYFSGILLIYPNIPFAVITICTITGIHFQILREEKFLAKKFGTKYKEYQKTTRRYI